MGRPQFSSAVERPSDVAARQADYSAELKTLNDIPADGNKDTTFEYPGEQRYLSNITINPESDLSNNAGFVIVQLLGDGGVISAWVFDLTNRLTLNLGDYPLRPVGYVSVKIFNVTSSTRTYDILLSTYQQ